MSVDINVIGRFRGGRRRAPSINWANTNARAVFELVGIPVVDNYLVGDLSNKAIPDILRNVIGALNSKVRRQSLDRAEASGTGLRGARYIETSNTDEQTVRRLQELQDLLVYAQKHNLGIGWN